MVGYGPNKGLVPKLCDRLFQAMRENQETRQCQVKSRVIIIYQHSVSCRCVVVVKFKTSLFLMSPQVFFSMLEIYNEQVTEGNSSYYFFCVFLCHHLLFVSLRSVQVVDLLSRGSRTPGGLRVREEQQRGFYVEGLRTVPCESAPQVQRWMESVYRRNTSTYSNKLCETVKGSWMDNCPRFTFNSLSLQNPPESPLFN